MVAAPNIVVDASVAVKWVLITVDSSQKAQALLTETRQAGGDVIVPPHMRGEVANVLYQKMRSRTPARQITEREAEIAFATFLSIPLTVVTPASLYAAAFSFARAHNLPCLYDAL